MVGWDLGYSESFGSLCAALINMHEHIGSGAGDLPAGCIVIDETDENGHDSYGDVLRTPRPWARGIFLLPEHLPNYGIHRAIDEERSCTPLETST